MIPMAVFGAATGNLLANGSFDNGIDAWQTNAPHLTMEGVPEGNRQAARIIVPDEVAVSWPYLFQEIDAQPGDLFDLRVDAMGRNVHDGYGVYAAIEFHNADGKRLSFTQTAAVLGEDRWTPLRLQSIVPDGACRVRVCLILNGHGEAYFDNATLTLLENVATGPIEGPITLTVTDEVVCDSLIGFGAEDDGWFYNPENAEHGVTEADWAIRDGRVTWMDPDWIRMFCWYKDWNPSGDWTTFTFDSPNMQSHYRTLDLYQRIGAVVNLVGVEWSVANPYDEPQKVVTAIGALFEHLIREKGYTCLQEWTLTNEPNGAFATHMAYDFARFADLHRRMKAEFTRRGLDVRIVGSDDTGGLPWFTQCVEDDAYYETADLFASHRYLAFPDRVLAPYFFNSRLELLDRRQPRKPFVVAEFGFQDARSGTLENPIMEDYPYAVWTTAFIIEGLNRGVAGFSIWCLSEVYYPAGSFMNYGLWNFKDDNWRVRPVYHAIANFTRLTERGDQVRKCTSSSPRHVIAAKVGDTVFWTNRADEPAGILLENAHPGEVRIFTEATLEGDRECGTSHTLTEGRFTAPAQSFGYAR